MRAFLAIPIVPPGRPAFDALRGRLMDELPDVRWAPADSPHITLHFFGSISTEDAGRALDAVRPVCAAQKPFVLHLEGLGAFPNGNRPSVLWCGVNGDTEALCRLAQDTVTALRSAGFPTDERPYHPHCTLGRPRQSWPAACRSRWKELMASTTPVTPTFMADHAILYDSLSTSTGVRHSPRETLPFDA